MIWLAHLLGNVLLGALACVWAAFALTFFLRARWEATPIGRSLMAFALVVVMLTGLGVLRQSIGDTPVFAWLRAAALAGAALLSARFLVLLIATQRPERRPPDPPTEM
ncbi:putative phage holin [Streptomonospora litoralis]|uniref:Uncharacterized protein n=1 Tax=Streptomonospora litoralis TaxID=2498135 RepID=A0A4P6Q7P5_9ACTN|nr:hypothetical protein [Streptomonospora litoralis]QBI56765.1 hypothetical protein EKD16_25120 [Streptomonospora litoralis]